MQRSGQKKGKGGVRDTSAQMSRGAAKPVQRRSDFVVQGTDVVRLPVRERTLGMPPDSFVGVQLGRIAGEVLHVQARAPRDQLADLACAVNLGVVEQHDDVPAQVTQEVAEELADFPLTDVGEVQAVVEPQMSAAGAHRDGRNRRDFLAPRAVAQHRRPPARRPRLDHRRNDQEARFVEEDEVGTQPCGVFFTRGHCWRVQRAIACSSRSRARRSGF